MSLGVTSTTPIKRGNSKSWRRETPRLFQLHMEIAAYEQQRNQKVNKIETVATIAWTNVLKESDWGTPTRWLQETRLGVYTKQYAARFGSYVGKAKRKLVSHQRKTDLAAEGNQNPQGMPSEKRGRSEFCGGIG